MTRTANSPPWFDPAMPPREDCVLKAMLDARAQQHPERRVALFEDGTSWTYAECLQHVRSAAAGLQQLGVRKGDRVLAWLPSGMPILLTWFAANYLGAVFVPLNTAYRGRILEHVINNAAGSVMVAHHELIERLRELDLKHLRRVIAVGGSVALGGSVAVGGGVTPTPTIEVLDEQVLQTDSDRLDDSVRIDPWDIQSIIYTSGTTGLSKGVLSPYLQLYTTAVVNYGYLEQGASVLVNLPMFHIGGTSPTYCALLRSGMIHLVDGFSTAKFWDQVRAGNCATTSGLIGVMASFLAKQPPRPDDGDNPLRCLTMFPINDATVAFSKRFGFDYMTGFNMTEVSSPLVTEINAPVHGTCGKPRTGVECRLVDEHDMEVPRGTPGELIVRSDTPWTMLAGYDGMPEATAAIWRNGWFHTGDSFRQDAEGYFFFVDRIKDTIRRRGENISSFEVEAAVRLHPDVDEVVAVGVANEIAEQDVLVAVCVKSGRNLDPRALVEFLVPRIAYFMVPRYVRLVADMPRTETNKIRKIAFRDQGVTADTWDRESAGLVLHRERL